MKDSVMNHRFFRLLAAASLATLVSATAAAQDKLLKVGVTPGPHAQIFEVVKKVAAREGLKIQIIEFSDYMQPNAALAIGDLDVNSYQHLPFLEDQIKDRGYRLVSAAPTVNFPIGIYSKKIKHLNELREGASFGIPNNPSNSGRVLNILQESGLIQLKPDAGLKATPLDIADNPRKIRFFELEAAQLPRSLEDMDASAINTNYAMSAGLDPKKDAIAQERADGPYVNLLVVREEDRNKPWVATLIKAYHSDEVKRFIADTFGDSMIPAW
jgi:D-methionine transport system substrate-binding protein